MARSPQPWCPPACAPAKIPVQPQAKGHVRVWTSRHGSSFLPYPVSCSSRGHCPGQAKAWTWQVPSDAVPWPTSLSRGQPALPDPGDERRSTESKGGDAGCRSLSPRGLSVRGTSVRLLIPSPQRLACDWSVIDIH